MRQILLPIDPDRRWRETPLVAGFGLRPLREVLADVLIWRCRTAAAEQSADQFRGAPTFHIGIPVPDADLHAFAAGQLDDDLLDLWLRACLALRWDGVRHDWGDLGPPAIPVPTLGLLHPLAASLRTGIGQNGDVPRLALDPAWAVRLAAGQVPAVHVEAVRRLQQAGWYAPPAQDTGVATGVAIAAALLPRCRNPFRALTHYLGAPIRQDQQEHDHDQNSQMAEEMA